MKLLKTGIIMGGGQLWNCAIVELRNRMIVQSGNCEVFVLGGPRLLRPHSA